MREELNEFLSPAPGLAFGDIGWNRDDRPPHLRGQTKPLVTGESPRRRINLSRLCHTLLPDQEVSITLDLSISTHINPPQNQVGTRL